MHWVKKAMYGSFFMLFVFIFGGILSELGLPIFSAEFITITGLVLILAMGVFETNLVTYE